MHIQGCQGSDWAGRAVKELRTTETLFFFCSSTMLTSKIITEIIQNSELSACPKAAMNLIPVDLDKPSNYP